MEHNELYKHLANVYISKPSDKAKKFRTKLNPIFVLLTVNTTIIGTLLFVIILDRIQRPTSPFKIASYALNINDNDHPLKIKYQLCNPVANKNQVDLFFDDFNLSSFKNVRMFIKGNQQNTKRIVFLLENKGGGKAVAFLDGITNDWKVYVVPLKSFEGIKDFSVINKLSFGVENWQLNSNQGQIFIGDITFLK